jgi:hypothetical protein
LARINFIDFVLLYSHPAYRPVLEKLYHAWQDINARDFQERLRPPHITIARTPSRSISVCKPITDWGGRMQITLDERIVFATRKFVHRPWTSEGTFRFLRDGLLAGTVRQYLYESEQFDESEIRHSGEAVADVSNRIGRAEGLPRVYTRRRGPMDAGKPLANRWPFNVRPEGYYLGDVTPPGKKRAARPAKPRGVALFASLCVHFLEAGRRDFVDRLIRDEAGRPTEPRSPATCRYERGESSYFDRLWLSRNGGLAQTILDVIRVHGMTDQMPLLAVALEQAGCSNELLLGHCRLPLLHTRDCWALKTMLAA